jgi:hypothetical protein
MAKTITFKFKKETPGTVCFHEVDENGDEQEVAFATIPTLYIRKTALGKGNVPQQITGTFDI